MRSSVYNVKVTWGYGSFFFNLGDAKLTTLNSPNKIYNQSINQSLDLYCAIPQLCSWRRTML